MGRLDELPLTEREIKGPPGLLARPTPIITSSTFLAFLFLRGGLKKGKSMVFCHTRDGGVSEGSEKPYCFFEEGKKYIFREHVQSI